MDTLTSLITASIGYLFYAVIISENLFHRVWSVAILAFVVIAAALATLPLSRYTIPLSFAGLLTLGICLWLSPLHALFVPLRTINSGERFQILPAGAAEKPADADVPLPSPPYYVDIVAVHGLASNPKTTWNSRTAKTAVDDSGVLVEFMWLRDSLVSEGLGPRAMIFRHDTIWEANAIRKSLHDHGNDLIRALRHERGDIEDKKRPIIFIGHSFGGLIIKQALVNASLRPNDESCRDIYQNSIGFIFMGDAAQGCPLHDAGETSVAAELLERIEHRHAGGYQPQI